TSATGTGLLDNTGLVLGVTAINVGVVDTQADIAAYTGPREAPTLSDFLAAINNPANWIAQDVDAVNNSNDGVGPDAPFATDPFVANPPVQQSSFASESVTVSQSEGDAGTTTILTFTVQRINGTTGDVNFTGFITPVTADAADFGGRPLTFSGTIADG